MKEEPSVLDYVIQHITFWREKTVQIPAPEGEEAEAVSDRTGGKNQPYAVSRRWLIWMPPLLAWTGQLFLAPPSRAVFPGVLFYTLSAASLVYLLLAGRWQLTAVSSSPSGRIPLWVRWRWLAAGILASALAFYTFLGNRFSLLNIPFWLFGTAAVIWSLWVPEGWWERVRDGWDQFREKGLQLSPWAILTVLVFAGAAFYRFYRLNAVPPEMFSDHAEKLIDVSDVLSGQYPIFFVRNTGREAFQMYLTAVVARVFNTGISFLSLKIGTCLAGLLTLPYLYLLGKEVGNRRVGLTATFLAGVAYWPNVIARVALRFALYPFFAAPTLYYLIRGLRRGRRNDFIYAGLALGLGLHGYSPFRIMPVLVIVVVVLYALHHLDNQGIRNAVLGLIIVGLISLLVFLPLLRFALNNLDMFSYRMNTRMTEMETEFPAPPLVIFFKNLWRSLVMFQWDNGRIWVHSIPRRPALGLFTAGLFTLGVVLVAFRYLRNRHWLDLTLLLSIPLMMLPSILSLAFPSENPSLNRSGGALIPVFIIAALAVEGLWGTIKSAYPSRWGHRLAWSAVLLLVLGVGSVNYQLVFEEYRNQFQQKAWNTSELGAVIDQFADTVGTYQQAWVVPYPHWVDTRLVGIHAEGRVVDYALWREDISLTETVSLPKMYLVKPEDAETIQVLRDIYPEGLQSEYAAQVPNQNFLIYYVLK